MNRWIRLSAAVIAMMMIANLQYAWTLFVLPIITTHQNLFHQQWKLSDVQWGFTLFIAFETWAMPFSGWLIDLVGPRLFLSVAGLLCGIGWAGIGQANTLTGIYVLYSLAGFGASLVYCGCTGIGMKWFPDKRGLAAGLIAAGFGSGAALFISPIAHIVHTQDYRAAFLYTGIVQGLVIVLAAQFLGNPPKVQRIAAASVKVRTHGEDFNSFQMLRTPQFYMMFAMALMMGIGGLMATAQVGPMSKTLGYSAAILTLSLTINPLANGGGRLFWGWVSDLFGREQTMVAAFGLQALILLSVVTLGKTSPAMFVVTVALVFFTWGEVYSLFPSACADFFGAKNASSNYSFLYSAKGVASIMGGGLAAKLFEKTGSWDYGFYACAAMAFVTAFMALGLKRMPMPKKPQPASTSPSASTAVGR
ncbi:MAG TPA: oxalate/formate MFS antiporter [Bryobacteraceae bacterium]|nr:oxalate/formate MFS antiporter [Bryobacteraceae bacterium]